MPSRCVLVYWRTTQTHDCHLDYASSIKNSRISHPTRHRQQHAMQVRRTARPAQREGTLRLVTGVGRFQKDFNSTFPKFVSYSTFQIQTYVWIA